VCERVSGGARLVDGRGGFDIVLATGVLHHLDDEEARELFRTAREALRPGGRLVTLDGCYVDGQSRMARYLLSRDRGKFVRAPEAYVRLARSQFEDVQASVRDDLLRIPYTHVALVCVN
jgi:SAM-dependent methyltransferase